MDSDCKGLQSLRLPTSPRRQHMHSAVYKLSPNSPETQAPPLQNRDVNTGLTGSLDCS